MLSIFKHLRRKEWVLVLVSTAFICVQVWLDLKLPDYMREITTLVQTSTDSLGEVWAAGGKMLLCALGSLATAIAVGYFAARIAASVAFRVRASLYGKVEDFSMEEINRFSTSSLITRSTNDITQVQMIIAMGLQALIRAPIMAAWAIVKIAGKNWNWSLATGCAVFAMLALVTTLVVFALPKFKIIQSLTDKLNAATRENLTGVRVVRAYNAEKYQEGKFEQANQNLTNTQLFVNRLMAIMHPGMTLVMNGLMLSIYWIGAYLIDAAGLLQRITLFSDMVVYIAYAMQVVMAFMMLVMIFIMLPRATVSAHRINEVLNTKTRIKDGDKGSPSWGTGQVEFKNVSFKYPLADEYVLKNVSFTAGAGETVAFIGSTGSGKSTVVNLIPRFYDATEGQILVDGQDIRDYKQEDLHNKIGYVPQRAVIFSGTVASNIAFGEGAGEAPDEDDIKAAASVAQASEFIDKLEDGYSAHVSQGGTNLSGGQKQRVAIARAVCREAEILIFDDSFSALDYKTDRELRKQLKEQTIGSTTFIVTQRIGTIRHADKIIVLDDGEVVGIGTHDTLLKDCKVYQEIASSQLSKEELNYA
ncbi:MAG TPA: ABC transporter ATP-binding protein [Candidatus Limiplasma sp.]|nr:ABC transporter ATP-binding protein [Candidatus Limiplasma sp.]